MLARIAEVAHTDAFGYVVPTAKGERRVGVRTASAVRYAIEVSSGIDYRRAVLDEFLAARGFVAGPGA